MIKRVVIVVYLLALHGTVAWLLLDKFVLRNALSPDWTAGPVHDPNPDQGPQADPAALPSETPPPAPTPVPSIVPQASAQAGRLIIPVQGVTPGQLIDTFADSRSEGRVHDAIDIPAPAGTPVLAAADGEIMKFHDSEKGGITIYQMSTDRKYIFYYAHLQSRALGLAEKQFVTQGTTIGYVGDTGNAGSGNTHLHFQIMAATDPNRFWNGININPFPILRGDIGLE